MSASDFTGSHALWGSALLSLRLYKFREGAIEQGQVLAMHLWLKRTTLSRTSVKRTAISHTFSKKSSCLSFSDWKFRNTSCSAVVSTSAGDICISSTVRIVSRAMSWYIFSVDREHTTLMWILCWNYRWDRGIELCREKSEYRRSREEDRRRLNIERKDHKSWSWRSRFWPFCFREFWVLESTTASLQRIDAETQQEMA